MTAPYLPRLTRQQLEATLASFPAEVRVNGATESFLLALAILKFFFGPDWLDRYVTPDTARPNFLRIDETDPINRDLTALRVIDLAEVLYNLQSVPGFAECIAKMREGDIEGTFGELDLGRMLYLNQVSFRFVVAQGVKTFDYDVEVIYPDGTVAFAEAKCSIESTDLGEKTIKNKLNEARAQLPPGGNGIIFVKMPPRWMEEPGFMEKTVGVATAFLAGTTRVVSVKFYTSPRELIGGYIKQQHAYREVSKPTDQLGIERDWTLFRQ